MCEETGLYHRYSDSVKTEVLRQVDQSLQVDNALPLSYRSFHPSPYEYEEGIKSWTEWGPNPRSLSYHRIYLPDSLVYYSKRVTGLWCWYYQHPSGERSTECNLSCDTPPCFDLHYDPMAAIPSIRKIASDNNMTASCHQNDVTIRTHVLTESPQSRVTQHR